VAAGDIRFSERLDANCRFRELFDLWKRSAGDTVKRREIISELNREIASHASVEEQVRYQCLHDTTTLLPYPLILCQRSTCMSYIASTWARRASAFSMSRWRRTKRTRLALMDRCQCLDIGLLTPLLQNALYQLERLNQETETPESAAQMQIIMDTEVGRGKQYLKEGWTSCTGGICLSLAHPQYVLALLLQAIHLREEEDNYFPRLKAGKF
jgi:hypothetical protein